MYQKHQESEEAQVYDCDQPEVDVVDLAEFKRVPVDDIEVGALSDDVSGLIDSIGEYGLLHPIAITADNKLVAGRKRLKAVKESNFSHVIARIVEGSPEDLEMISIEENLVPKPLTFLELAVLLNRWKTAYETKYPLTKKGGDYKMKKKLSANLAFRVHAANRTGYKLRSVERLVKIGSKLTMKTIELMKNTSIADVEQQLEFLANRSTDRQEQIAAAVSDKKHVFHAANVWDIDKNIERDEYKAKLCSLPLATTAFELFDVDFNLVGDKVKDGSIDVIIVDPPWSKEYISIYERLGAFAARVLKPGGSLLMMLGQMYQLEMLDGVRKHPQLNYHWELSYKYKNNASAKVRDKHVYTHGNSIWWFVKGEYRGNYVPDVLDGGGKDKQFHDWGQSVEGFAQLVKWFSKPGETVLDCCMGGGTTGVAAVDNGRKFIGIDSDKECVEVTRRRLEEVIEKRNEQQVPELDSDSPMVAGSPVFDLTEDADPAAEDLDADDGLADLPNTGEIQAADEGLESAA